MSEKSESSGKPACPRRCPLRRLTRAFQWAVNLLVLAVVLLVFTPLGDWYGSWLLRRDEPARADYIVVLGGDQTRAVEAARLYRNARRDGWTPKVIVSSKGEWADRLANVAAAYGVPRADIRIDHDATRTHDHPITIAALEGVDKTRDRFIIVTSPYHTRRAMDCFAHEGYAHCLSHSPDWEAGGPLADPSDKKTRWASLLPKTREIVALLYYRLRGWI
ncbi:MAG: hypothetical protein BIFFINMI_01294 [Phycisphaerae bacterium]|nr:hypothetical protein [Phycisphaerae bacterium]